MGDRLDTTARCILIPDTFTVGDGEGAVRVSLGGDVDVRIGEMEGRGSRKEDCLGGDKVVEFGHNFVVEGHHFGGRIDGWSGAQGILVAESYPSRVACVDPVRGRDWLNARFVISRTIWRFL